jgi:ADP-ribose pyrophosphatase
MLLMTEKSLHDLPPGDAHLKEERLDTHDLYSGIFLNMKRDTVRMPDGGEAVREYLTHPGAVAIVAILDDGRILLERQYRYPVARVCMEIPAGKLDLGEDPLVCARRELQEETGYGLAPGGKLESLGWFLPSQGFTDEHVYLFKAEPVCVVSRPEPDGSEHISPARQVSSKELRRMIAAHEITNALTLALYARLAAKGEI